MATDTGHVGRCPSVPEGGWTRPAGTGECVGRIPAAGVRGAVGALRAKSGRAVPLERRAPHVFEGAANARAKRTGTRAQRRTQHTGRCTQDFPKGLWIPRACARKRRNAGRGTPHARSNARRTGKAARNIKREKERGGAAAYPAQPGHPARLRHAVRLRHPVRLTQRTRTGKSARPKNHPAREIRQRWTSGGSGTQRKIRRIRPAVPAPSG